MRRAFFISCFLWLITALSASHAHAASTPAQDTGRTEVKLIAEHNRVPAGDSFYVALDMQFDAGWYSYWRNPGDSGQAVKLVWDLPESLTAGEINWPVPKVKKVGPIISYAVDGRVVLPVKIQLSDQARAGDILPIKLEAFYLVCADICVPEQAQFELELKVGAGLADPRTLPLIQTALKHVPRRSSAKGRFSQQDGQTIIELTELPEAHYDAAKVFPHDERLIAHSEPSEVSYDGQTLRMSAPVGFGWDDGTLPETQAVTLAFEGDLRAIVVDLQKTETLTPFVNPQTAPPQILPPARASFTMWRAALGALLGGLILNLMPCVFPIVSLKALALAKTAHEDRGPARRGAWAYTVGVLLSFVALAFILIGLKMAGAQIGWGFQLQSPWLVGLLAVLLFGIGLNLLGVFEFGAAAQNIGTDAVRGSGLAASFMTGVLAVIVATPCTAPFMAGAIGYALTQNMGVILAVFLALGLGFALPFLLVAYVPRLLSRLPRPGPWMERFREFLAFPMFAAALYLVWVLSVQAGPEGVVRVLLAMLALGFAVWLWAAKTMFARGLAGLTIIAAILLPISVKPSVMQPSNIQAVNTVWSPETVAEHLAKGRTVFVDFTAAWCVTCKINERLVLHTKKTQALLAQTNTVLLTADWTHQDADIAQELERFGRAGVPLYLVFKPNDPTPQILPQTLSFKTLEAALN